MCVIVFVFELHLLDSLNFTITNYIFVILTRRYIQCAKPVSIDIFSDGVYCSNIELPSIITTDSLIDAATKEGAENNVKEAEETMAVEYYTFSGQIMANLHLVMDTQKV